MVNSIPINNPPLIVTHKIKELIDNVKNKLTKGIACIPLLETRHMISSTQASSKNNEEVTFVEEYITNVYYTTQSFVRRQ